MINELTTMSAQGLTSNYLSESNMDWEGFSDHANADTFKFDEYSSKHIEDTLASEGVRDIKDLDACNTQELVEAVDARVNQLRPGVHAKANMSHFGKKDDIWERFRVKLEPKYLEAPSDKIQQEQIAETMFDMKELQYENWTKLSLKGKVEILNQLEQKVATIEHRSAMTVRSEVMEPGLQGYQQGDGIALNQAELEATDLSPENLENMLNTVIHEGRHAYQNYNVYERQVHGSDSEVESWRENYEMLGYASGDPVYTSVLGFPFTNEGLKQIGARLYYYQPVEIDARQYADDTMSAYHNKLNS